MPYFMLLAVAALQRLDPSLDEAAADLGAGPLLTFVRVTLPQVWPVLLAATLLAFALSFDEFVITFFVIGPDSTLPMFIFSSLRRTVDPTINAISSLLLTTSVVLFGAAFALTVRRGGVAALASRPSRSTQPGVLTHGS
jgi:ABC-type spermidine/putrescine transport system permease subunit II